MPSRFDIVQTTSNNYTASDSQFVRTAGDKVTLPSPSQDAIVAIRDQGQDVSVETPSGSIGALGSVAQFDSYTDTIYFISDGTDWYPVDGSNPIVAALAEITNYLEDDWDDNSLTNRTNADSDVFAHPSSNEAGDVLIGRYRPEWTTENGSPTATNSRLELSDGDLLATKSEQDTGEFSFDFQTNGDDTGGISFSFIKQTTQYRNGKSSYTGYYNYIQGDGGTFSIARTDSGSFGTNVVETSWSGDNSSFHRSRVTRDSYGDFELFLDGTSKGTGTDSTYQTSRFLALYSGLANDVYIDNMVNK